MTDSTGPDFSALRSSSKWRLTVWTLRVQFLGLFFLLFGLLFGDNAIFIVGLVAFLGGAVLTLVGLIGAFRSLPEPRPTFLDVRWVLLRDMVGRRP